MANAQSKTTKRGVHSAATVVLFQGTSEKDKYLPIANYIVPYGQDTGTVLTPKDHDAWELAKAYTLLGCSNRLVLAVHSMLHFPMDTVNAISKSVLPKENLLLKLLLPHFEFSLELDISVLTSWNSPIKNHWQLPYTGLTGDQYNIAQLFVSAYIGIKGRDETYPPYTFSLEPRLPDTNYGEFQHQYYVCIERFAKKVLSHLTEDDKFYIKSGRITPTVGSILTLR